MLEVGNYQKGYLTLLLENIIAKFLKRGETVSTFVMVKIVVKNI